MPGREQRKKIQPTVTKLNTNRRANQGFIGDRDATASGRSMTSVSSSCTVDPPATVPGLRSSDEDEPRAGAGPAGAASGAPERPRASDQTRPSTRGRRPTACRSVRGGATGRGSLTVACGGLQPLERAQVHIGGSTLAHGVPTLRRQTRAMEGTPDHEVPAGAVPQPSEQHRQEEVAVLRTWSASVATQRDVQIVAQPPSRASCANDARTPGSTGPSTAGRSCPGT